MVSSALRHKNRGFIISTAALVAAILCLLFCKNIRLEFPEFNFTDNFESYVENVESHQFMLTVGSGDTLGKLLNSIGMSSADIHTIAESLKPKFNPAHLRLGSKLIVEPATTDPETGDLIALDPQKITLALESKSIVLDFDAASNSYKVSEVPIEYVTKTKLVQGTVDGSLYNAAKNSGANKNVIMAFINLFSYSMDFQRDVQRGDTFKIFYEYQQDKTGRKVKEPKILYAMLRSGGKTNAVYLHEKSNGMTDYFNSKGESLRRSLLSTPINGARITSNYGLRKHPVLGYSKMHRGLDYGAPRGTPIVAAGDGVVTFAKKQSRGYGNHLKIKHNGTFSTLYAHMSKFAVKSGTRVSQGQVIGYVGATGMATGPHLHYEVIKNGQKVNPRNISFPKIPPLKGNELARFKKSIVEFDTMIAALEANSEKQIAEVSIKDSLKTL